jgi:hypothetical protein
MLNKKMGILIILLGLTNLYSLEFRAHGSKAVSMGGTGVASSKSAFATYYNPALLARTKSGFDMSIDAGIGLQDSGLAQHLDALNRYDIKKTIDHISDNAPDKDGSNAKPNTQEDRDNLTRIQNRLLKIKNDDDVIAMPSGDIYFRINSFAFGVGVDAVSVSNINVDSQRIALISKVERDGSTYYAEYDQDIDRYIVHTTPDIYEQESLEYAVDNNLTYIKNATIMISEVPVSYGYGFNFEEIGELDVGATLKFMQGSYALEKVNIEDPKLDFDNKIDSSTFGIDIGLAFSPTIAKDLTIGLIGKNLNTPEFKTDADNLQIEPMFRAGFAYQVYDILEVALDIDLTTNKTEIIETEHQDIGLGINLEPVSWFHLRGGATQNLAQSETGVIYSAGLGLGPKQFMLDISAQYSPDTFTYDGNNYPKYSRVNFAITSQW